jgi:hypothetical protein
VLLVAALVAAVGVGGLLLRGSGARQAGQAAEVRARAARTVLAEIDRPGSRHALLTAPNGSPTAGVLLSGQPQVASVTRRANQPGRDVYVLWGVEDDGRTVPLGTFDVAPDDHALRPVNGPVGDVPEFGRYAVSVEGGRVAPPVPGQLLAFGQVAVAR